MITLDTQIKKINQTLQYVATVRDTETKRVSVKSGSDLNVVTLSALREVRQLPQWLSKETLKLSTLHRTFAH